MSIPWRASERKRGTVAVRFSAHTDARNLSKIAQIFNDYQEERTFGVRIVLQGACGRKGEKDHIRLIEEKWGSISILGVGGEVDYDCRGVVVYNRRASSIINAGISR